jgi:hypothetical protein
MLPPTVERRHVPSDRAHRYAMLLRRVRGARTLVVGEPDAALIASLCSVAGSCASIMPDPFEAPVKLPFDDAQFDSVVIFTGLASFADPASFLRETNRVLDPGGTLYVAIVSQGAVESHLAYIRPLLRSAFRTVTVLAQRAIVGSLLQPLDEGFGEECFVRGPSGMRNELRFEFPPTAYVAICAKSGDARPIRSLFLEENRSPRRGYESAASAHGAGADVLRDRQLAAYAQQMQQLRLDFNHASQVAHERASRIEEMMLERLQDRQRIAQLENTERMRSRENEALRENLRESIAVLNALQKHAAALERRADETAGALRRAEDDAALLRNVLGSRSWRITKPLRLVLRTARREGEGRP